MSTKARKRWSWLVMAGMGAFVLGVGYWANEVHRQNVAFQEERDEQAYRAELIVMSAPVPLIMCGEEGKITVVNPAAEQLFGYSHDELVGERIYKLIPPDIQYNHDKVFRAAEARARARPERRYALYRENIHTEALHRGGEHIPVILSIRVIKYGDQIEFIATIRRANEPHPEKPEVPGRELPSVEQRLQYRMKAAK